MRRIVLALVVFGACGGTQIPVHSGYKSEKAKPWTKAKTLNFDEKMEAKAEATCTTARCAARSGTRSRSRQWRARAQARGDSPG